jgi:rhamnosyl/mannosyltransferase
MLERVLDSVDLIVAGSPNMVEASEFLAPRADKCRVVPYGIHVERFDATPEMLARAAEFRSPHRRPIVLFVGRLVYYKGAEVLVRAMPDIDADVVLIGEGPLELELRELGRELGVAERLTFLTPMDDFDLAAWYVFCLPSVARSEAFGLVQIEAHAAGTPVVSTRLTTGVPFANLHGVTGLTVEPEDVGALAAALRRILEDDELRSRLAVQARERARNDFTTERMVADMLEVYREAIETRTVG